MVPTTASAIVNSWARCNSAVQRDMWASMLCTQVSMAATKRPVSSCKARMSLAPPVIQRSRYPAHSRCTVA